MKLIERKTYLDQLQAVKGTPEIKVITGIRRSGKSKLMDAFIALLLKDDNTNIIRIKLNLKTFEELRNADKLYSYISESYNESKTNYLFIDEVQLCHGFEWVINSLHEEEKYDIYLTGSNAFLLSSDLATLFGGRVFEIKMFPFSFNEYLLYYPSTDLDSSFESFVQKGGMSGSYLYGNTEDARKYVENIYKTTIARDIVEKFRIENEQLLLMIGDFLMDNVGNSSSIRNIANKLSSNTYTTNDKTVGAYISHLCKSFMFYPINRYDIKGKKYLESDIKYYLADTSFRFAVLGTKRPDYGHIYENIVAIELLRRGYEVYVGKLYNTEIDFVAIKNGIRTYIQVSDDISGEETFNREVQSLLKIRDAFPKILIARTKHETSQYQGIEIIDIARWLVSQK